MGAAGFTASSACSSGDAQPRVAVCTDNCNDSVAVVDASAEAMADGAEGVATADPDAPFEYSAPETGPTTYTPPPTKDAAADAECVTVHALYGLGPQPPFCE
jgi:hypothetical protein